MRLRFSWKWFPSTQLKQLHLQLLVAQNHGEVAVGLETLEIKLHVWLWYTLSYGKRSCWFLVKLTWRLPNIEHEGYLLKLFVLVTANLKNYHTSYHTNHISYCWWWWCYCCWGSIFGDNNLLTKSISHLFVWLWLYFVYLR